MHTTTTTTTPNTKHQPAINRGPGHPTVNAKSKTHGSDRNGGLSHTNKRTTTTTTNTNEQTMHSTATTTPNAKHQQSIATLPIPITALLANFCTAALTDSVAVLDTTSLQFSDLTLCAVGQLQFQTFFDGQQRGIRVPVLKE